MGVGRTGCWPGVGWVSLVDDLMLCGCWAGVIGGCVRVYCKFLTTNYAKYHSNIGVSYKMTNLFFCTKPNKASASAVQRTSNKISLILYSYLIYSLPQPSCKFT
jgi:hypothetical protein